MTEASLGALDSEPFLRDLSRGIGLSANRFAALVLIANEQWAIENDWRPADPNIRVLVRDGHQSVDSLRVAMGNFVLAYQRMVRGLLPRSYYLLLALLTFIGAAGVVAPLTRLSARSNEERAVFLAMFGLGLALVALFLFLQIRDLRSFLHIAREDIFTKLV